MVSRMSSGPRAACQLLSFYVEAGADALLGEEPVDRMAESATPELAGEAAASRREQGASAASTRGDRFSSPPLSLDTAAKGPALAAPPPPDVAVMAAREAAASAKDLEELRTLLDAFHGCALRAMATQLVFADGNPQARVMFVGEAPGYEEDMTGKPFVGPSGKLLDRMMQAIGLDRTSAYIANVVPWRPPGNRTPTPQETATCLPFIRRQIELADPDILVCLGQPATHTLLGTTEGITRTRGRWFKFDTGQREIRAIATLHPAHLLRQPLQKRFAWRDFMAIKKALGNG
jgi:uracil-DNA glycosylase